MEKIRIRHGDDEIEVEGSNSFIAKQLKAFYERLEQKFVPSPIAGLKKEIETPVTKKIPSRIPTPAEFYKAKNRTDGIAQILIFGKYLDEFRGVSEFSRQQINELAQEVRISKDIHGQYFTNAVKQGLLRNQGYGKYSLTLSAEEVLSAMK